MASNNAARFALNNAAASKCGRNNNRNNEGEQKIHSSFFTDFSCLRLRLFPCSRNFTWGNGFQLVLASLIFFTIVNYIWKLNELCCSIWMANYSRKIIGLAFSWIHLFLVEYSFDVQMRRLMSRNMTNIGFFGWTIHQQLNLFSRNCHLTNWIDNFIIKMKITCFVTRFFGIPNEIEDWMIRILMVRFSNRNNIHEHLIQSWINWM